MGVAPLVVPIGSSGPPAEPSPIAALIDGARWASTQKLTLLLAALAVALDGFDNQILAIALPSIAREWHIAPVAIAPALSAGLFGMMIGSALGGALGDRFGRRTTLVASIALFGLLTLMVVAIGTPGALAAARFGAGLGLGSAMPNATALVGELTPRRRRTLAITIATLCSPVGAVLAGFAGGFILPQSGWRALFAAGGASALMIVAASAWLIEESPQYLARDSRRRDQLARFLGRIGEALPEDLGAISGRGPRVSEALRVVLSRRLRRDTLLLWTASIANMLALYAILSWLPTMLAQSGYSTRAASLSLSAFSIGGIAGSLAGSAVVDRWGSRLALGTMAFGAAMVSGAMAWAPLGAGLTAELLATMLALLGALAGGLNVLLFPLALNLYPVDARAGGLGLNLSIGRLGAVASPFIAAAATRHGGSMAFFLLYAMLLMVAAAAIFLLRDHIVPLGNTGPHHSSLDAGRETFG